MKQLIFIVLYLISCICLVAQTTKTYTITFDREDFTIEDYNDGKIVTSSEHNIAFDEDITKPAIPYKVVNILLPENQKLKSFSFNISDTQTTTGITLSANPIYITTDSDSDSISYPQSDYPIQEYPLEVNLLGEQVLEGYRYASFRVPVFSYNAVSRTITWASRISLSIETEENLVIAQAPTRTDIITGILENILFNPEEIYEPTMNASLRTATPSNSEDIKYLIITSQRLKSSFTPLANWKTVKGVKAKIVTVEEIYNEYATVEGSNQLKIKQCIYDYYTNGLEYVLLGGDETIVPVQKCYGHYTTLEDTVITDNLPTDLFYANLTGRLDWNADGDGLIGEITDNSSFFPNIAIGRFPINTRAQANLLVNKIVNYEKNPPMNNWANKMLLTGASGSNPAENMAGQSERMYSTYIQPYWSNVEKKRFYDTDTDFEGGGNYVLNSDNLQKQINNGYHHIHMNSHGTETAWWLERGTFLSYQTDSLSNPNPTIIATTACKTNAFDLNQTCLGEAFLRTSKSNVVAYLGATREGLDGFGTVIGPSSLCNGLFYRNIFSNKRTIGNALKYALRTVSSNYSGNKNYQWVLYGLTLMGDPNLDIHTDTIRYFTDWVDYRLNVSEEYIEIMTIHDDLAVSLTSKNDHGDSFYKALTRYNYSTGSTLYYRFERPQNISIEDLQLCLTLKNYLPLIIEDIEGTYFQNETYTGTRTFTGKNIYIGSDVTRSKPEGPVIIESGNITFDATNTVIIKNGFECKKGAVLEIK